MWLPGEFSTGCAEERARAGSGRGLWQAEGAGRQASHLRFSRILLASSCPITVSRISGSRSRETESLKAGELAPLGMAKWPRMIPSPKRAAAPNSPPSTFTHGILWSLGQPGWLLIDGVSDLVNHYPKKALPFGPPIIREGEGAPLREGQELFTPPQSLYCSPEKTCRGIKSTQGP